MAEREYHVTSFVVTTRPEHGTRVSEKINSMPGLEVHVEQQGKLVVTGEAYGVRELAELAGNLEQVDSVITVAPIYHEYADAEESAALMSRDELRNK